MPRQAERSETSLPWFTAAFSVVRRDGIHHEGFSPHNGPRVYPPAGVCTPVMDKDLLRKAHNLWHDLKPSNKAKIEFK